MTAPIVTEPQSSYVRAIAASKKARFDIDSDVIRGRRLDLTHKYLPDGLSFVQEIEGLSAGERRSLSQVQGRTYANVFGLVERFISAKLLELEAAHVFGDQLALEALTRFSDEELKHQEMFRRVEALAEEAMPPGYRACGDPNEVARLVLGKSTWAVLALTCHIELFTQVHYKQSIAPDPELSPLFKDVFLHHFKEEAQHALLDELEWRRVDAALTPEQRAAAVTDFIALVGAVDSLLSAQAGADAAYAESVFGRACSPDQRASIEHTLRRAYRFQYILSGVQRTRFPEILRSMIDQESFARVERALATLS